MVGMGTFMFISDKLRLHSTPLYLTYIELSNDQCRFRSGTDMSYYQGR